MFSTQRVVSAITWTLVLLLAVGCQTMTGRTAGQYVDDQKITAEVKSKLVADRASNLTRVGVTSTNGIVYLTGSVDSADRAARAVRLASEVQGVRSVVNNLQVTAAAAAPVALVDAAGTVTQFDPQTGVVTFQDGRMVRITNGTGVWGPASVATIRPGAQVFIKAAQPVDFHSAGAAQGVGSWRLGTVNHVDQAKGLIFLNDGTVVRVGPSTVLQAGAQRVTLAQIRPGAQIAVGIPPVVTPATVGANPSAYSGSALPRQSVTPVDSPQVQIFVVPQPR